MCGCVCMYCMWIYVHARYVCMRVYVLYVWMCACIACVDVGACIVCVDADTHLDNLGCQSLLTVPNLSTVEEEAAVTVQYKAQCLNQANLPKVLKSLPHNPPPPPKTFSSRLPPSTTNPVPQNRVQSSTIKRGRTQREQTAYCYG